MVEIDGDDVSQRDFIHFRQRMARTMKNKGNQRQRFAKAKRRQGLHQFPFPFAALRHAACILAVRKELPDFDLVLPLTLDFHQFQNAKLLDFFRDERISFQSRCLADFLENDQREDVAAINPFRVPVNDVFSGIGNSISALLRFVVPIYKRARPTDIDNFCDQLFREGSQAGPNMSASSTNSVSASPTPGSFIR